MKYKHSVELFNIKYNFLYPIKIRAGVVKFFKDKYVLLGMVNGTISLY